MKIILDAHVIDEETLMGLTAALAKAKECSITVTKVFEIETDNPQVASVIQSLFGGKVKIAAANDQKKISPDGKREQLFYMVMGGPLQGENYIGTSVSRMIRSGKLAVVRDFRIPMYRKHYAEVFIWDTSENMRSASPEIKGEWFGRATSCTSSIRPNGKICIPHKFGEVHLVEDKYNSEIVAHEFMHLINYWVQIKQWDWEKHDERIAWMCGKVHKNFWKKHYQLYKN